jgi:hypothetical protein
LFHAHGDVSPINLQHGRRQASRVAKEELALRFAAGLCASVG